jgi:hypothetical protein
MNLADLSHNELAIVTRYARRITDDADRQSYFDYCAVRLRGGKATDLLQICRDALNLFGPQP